MRSLDSFSTFNDGINFKLKIYTFVNLKNTTENSKINFTTCHKTLSREPNRIVYLPFTSQNRIWYWSCSFSESRKIISQCILSLFHFTTFDVVTICSPVLCLLLLVYTPSPSSSSLLFSAMFNIVEYNNPVMCAQYWSFLIWSPIYLLFQGCLIA